MSGLGPSHKRGKVFHVVAATLHDRQGGRVIHDQRSLCASVDLREEQIQATDTC
jgi:hypothetical protein